MSKLIKKYYDGGTSGSSGNQFQNGVMSGLQQGNAYSMIAQGVGGFASKFPTPNADLNSNNQMAAQVRDGVSNALLSSGNPYAMAAGAAVKVIDKTGGFTDVSEGLGAGNDIGNAIMSFALPGAGWFFNDSSKTDNYEMSANMAVMSRGYAGSVKDAKKAEGNAGAKLIFGRNKANNMIAEAKKRDDTISGIKLEADADLQTARTMTQQRAMSNQYALMGGYNQRYARAGKFGMRIDRIKKLSEQIKFKPTEHIEKEISSMKDGGKFFDNLFVPVIDEDDKNFFANLTFEESIPEFQEGGKTPEKKEEDSNNDKRERIAKLMKEVIEPAAKEGNKTAMRLMDMDQNDYTFSEMDVANGYKGKAGDVGNVYISSYGDETGHYIIPGIQYVNDKLEFIPNPVKRGRNDQWIKFPSEEDAIFFGENYHDFPELVPTLAKRFKEGGQMNVIPDGNLHARLHHMENAEGLTKKGIPVVDNEGNQQAEIEKEEIIFIKEVTEKLEELYKKYNSDEYTKKEKEDFAIEAGKLLSKEIIENTDDRAGLLANKFAEGGMFGQPELPLDPNPAPTTVYTGEQWFRKGFEALNKKYPAQLSLYIMRHAASEGNNQTGHYQLGGNGGNTKNTSKSTNPNSMLTYASQMINKYGGEDKFKAAKSWADYLGLLFRPDFMYNEEYSTNSKYLPMKANSYRVNGLLPNEAIQAYKSGYNQNNFVKSKYGPYTTINNWVTRLVADYNKNNPKNPILNINYTL